MNRAAGYWPSDSPIRSSSIRLRRNNCANSVSDGRNVVVAEAVTGHPATA